MNLFFRLLCGPGIACAACIQESGQVHGCSLQLGPLSLQHCYIITLSPSSVLPSSTTLQFTEDPPLPQRFSLLNKLPVLLYTRLRTLALLQIGYTLEIPLVSQTPQQIWVLSINKIHPWTVQNNTIFSFRVPHFLFRKNSCCCTYSVLVSITVRNTCSWICGQTVKMVKVQLAFPVSLTGRSAKNTCLACFT